MTRKILSLFAVLACTGLAGCLSPEEQRAQDNSACSGYGFARGSDAYANCMMQTKMARDQAEQEQMAQFWANERVARIERERRAAATGGRY